MKHIKKFTSFISETFEPRKVGDRDERLANINKKEKDRQNKLRSDISEYIDLENSLEDLHSYLEVDSPGYEVAKILKDDSYKSLSRKEVWSDDNLLKKVRIALKNRDKITLKKMEEIFTDIAEKYPILKKLENQMTDNPLLGQNIYGRSGDYTIDTPDNYNDNIKLSMVQANEYRDFLKDRGVKISIDDYEYDEED